MARLQLIVFDLSGDLVAFLFGKSHSLSGKCLLHSKEHVWRLFFSLDRSFFDRVKDQSVLVVFIPDTFEADAMRAGRVTNLVKAALAVQASNGDAPEQPSRVEDDGWPDAPVVDCLVLELCDPSENLGQ